MKKRNPKGNRQRAKVTKHKVKTTRARAQSQETRRPSKITQGVVGILAVLMAAAMLAPRCLHQQSPLPPIDRNNLLPENLLPRKRSATA